MFRIVTIFTVYRELCIGKQLDNQKTIEFNTHAHKILFLVTSNLVHK
jgi:hypothetical protein